MCIYVDDVMVQHRTALMTPGAVTLRMTL